MLLTLGMSGIVTNLLVALFLTVCVFLILIVLIQRPQGGGLSGAFGAGGSGAGQTAFGTRTGDALTYATIGIFIAYLGLAIGLVFAARNMATPIVIPQPAVAPLGGADGAADGDASTTTDGDDASTDASDDTDETPAEEADDDAAQADPASTDAPTTDDAPADDAPADETPAQDDPAQDPPAETVGADAPPPSA